MALLISFLGFLILTYPQFRIVLNNHQNKASAHILAFSAFGPQASNYWDRKQQQGAVPKAKLENQWFNCKEG